jgi:hypothetical protein
MIDVRRKSWIVDGLEIDARGQNRAGVVFSGDTQGSMLSNSEVHNGTASAAVATAANAHDVLIQGNHIHNYWRSREDAHGVAVEPTSRNITIRKNQIHAVSGDSVQCIGPEGYSNAPPAEDVLIEGNDLFGDRENAVDIKTCHRVTLRHNKLHDFLEAPGGCMVVVHMSARDVTIEDNEIYNGGKGIALGGNHWGPVPTNVVIRNNRFHNLRLGGTLPGTAIRVENSQNAHILENTFSEIDGPTLVIGHDDISRDLKVENNLFDAATAYHLGTHAPGFSSQHNSFLPGAAFITAQAHLDLAGWQQLGYDADATLFQ